MPLPKGGGVKIRFANFRRSLTGVAPPPAEREGEGAERRGRASGASRACDSTRGCSRSGNRRDFTSEGLGGAESFAEENLLDGGANS